MIHALEQGGVARGIAQAARVAVLALAATAVLGGCSLFSSKNKHEPAKLMEVQQVLAVRQVWSVSVGKSGRYVMQPAVAGNNVYVSAAGGTVTALDGATGRTVWQGKADVDLTTGPGSDGSLTVVAGEKGAVIAFDEKGTQKWKVAVNGEVLTAPLVGQGLVIVRTTDGRVLGLDPSNGERKWIYQRSPSALNLRSSLPMIFAGDNIILGFAGGKLGALSASNGALRWEAAVSYPRGVSEIERLNDVTGAPSVNGSQVCAASFQGRVACFDMSTGAPRWGRDFSSPTGVTQDDGGLFAADEKSVVYGFNAQNGADLWKNDALLWRDLGTPLAFGRAVIVGDSEGWLHFLSRDDGKFVARVKTDGSAIGAAPVVVGQTLVVQTRGGGVYGYLPK
ncbi:MULTISPECIES: outer membrane protein assembly factor BamB [Ralstonia]|jgi:outer membrane protein assembly factor BamB|uniref:Outer membrane protein assembly factor BamB n=3 Tax=Ralstonia TaxID=48736 RepID=A0AAD2BRV1_9RALS|nr:MULTISPECIES: outer membrane protein assembly factor BamB [Ralstonia]MBE3033726.1 outer membrane protein assembly factor BamB [Actinomycetota bacterium]MEA3270301.1 outer membrane protein assembly factor BamB [Pseudomonadota bacterium]ENZ79754.1 Beta-barrel assembly machine subunit BamB [Ralstonia pickettii OR214]MBB0026741.1 outer membrane protein assembly factor BamB [Ralstonia pickettii]MBB0037513.1 outer membrane protein assembly factor BamB [Ralstonia pickettii]